MNRVTRDVVALLRDLVGFNTSNPPGNELPVINYCSDFLRSIGFQTTFQPLTENRANLIAKWVPHDVIEKGTTQLVLSGHADTVPAGDLVAWHSPPFTLTEREGMLYGRGTCDMKGALAAFLAVAHDVATGSGALAREAAQRPFAITITADEEMGFSGINALVKDFPIPNAAGVIVGEPTSNIPITGHKGVFWFQVRFRGKAAHASRPDLGENAILLAAQFCTALMADYNASWHLTHHPVLGFPTLNVGRIAGGVKPNMVPDACTVWIDCRTVPPLSLPAIQSRIEEVARQVSPNAIVTPDPAPGISFWIPPDNFLVQVALEATESAGPGVYTAFTESSIFYHVLSLPAVILGPGSIEHAHSADEHVSRIELERSIHVYERCLALFAKRCSNLSK